jgi:hypothetical protein
LARFHGAFHRSTIEASPCPNSKDSNCLIDFSKTAYIAAQILQAKSSDSICLGNSPACINLKLFCPDFYLKAPEITVGPHIEVLAGSHGKIDCDNLTFITEDGTLSQGQETLKSWAKNAQIITQIYDTKAP